MQPLLSKKNPTCLVALSDSTQMQQFDVVSNNSELHLFLFAYSKASFTRTQSFERQISVQMSILTPFQKKKIPVHTTYLKTHILCSFICTGMVCHCKQEADCILVYATALLRIYLDNLSAKHYKHFHHFIMNVYLRLCK